MKDKALAAFERVKALAAKLYAWSPFAAGIAVGYFGKPFIQAAVTFTTSLARAALGFCLILAVLNCGGPSTKLFLKGDPGTPGAPGAPGADGYSLSSQFMSATECECPSGGNRLDIYLDMDRSFSASDGDVYQGSLISCNGASGRNGNNGQDGIAGPPGGSGPPGLNGNPGHDGTQGPAGAPGQDGTPGSNGHDGAQGPPGQGGHVSQKNAENCVQLSGDWYAKKGNGSENGSVGIYASSSCNGSHAQLNSANSTFWLSATDLAVYVDGQTVRVLTFN